MGDLELATSLAEPSAAAAWYGKAIEIARGQEARLWEIGPRPDSAGCGATRASEPKPETFSRRCTTGLPRASRLPI